MDYRPTIAISMGDPAGIGAEVIVKALSDPNLRAKARYIIYGPYFHLTPGKWVAHVAIELDGNVSLNRLGVDVFCGNVLCAVAARLPVRGAYGFEMRFEIRDPLRAVELRFQTLTGAIEGRLMLTSVTFSRVGADRNVPAMRATKEWNQAPSVTSST